MSQLIVDWWIQSITMLYLMHCCLIEILAILLRMCQTIDLMVNQK